jgi:hypothetical protein
MLSVSLFYWRPNQGLEPGLFRGDRSLLTVSQRFAMPVATRSNGIMITLPTLGSNRLEIGYWDTGASGASRAKERLNIYAANVAQGELVASRYKIRNIRVSWNYLTFPVPALDAKLRVKTYWEVQHTRLKPQISFPESAVPSAVVGAKQSITLPGAGVGLEYVASRRFRFDARLSGMAFPGTSRYVDAEATLIGTFGGLEILAGGKGFHFRTTPKDETYQQAAMWGPVFGLRWVFR